jgi:serine/threonine-protein kinase
MKPLSNEDLARLSELAGRPEIPGERYEILAKVGAGGMGQVFRARDRELEREVAIKVAHDALRSADAAERLGREARTIAALEHPSIPPVHEVGELVDGRAYYVMRFVHGRTLAEDPPRSNAALRLFLRLCETVAYAHSKGVTHRDLKPANVMLGPLGELYVMDWGIAGALGGGAERPAGTPGFMAPEQEQPGRTPIDARADVYALGGILAFLSTGTGPARDGSLELTALPRSLAAIIRRARALDPPARYPSAIELARDVAAYLDHEAVSAYREGPLERSGRFLVKHQFVVWLVVGYLVLRALVFFSTKR